jgi:RimJ/RimL family protein N-acetyltransferase
MGPPVNAVGLGIVQDEQLIGGFVFSNFTGHNIEVSAAVDRASWVTRGTLDQMFGYPFRQLGCTRITAITREDNKRTQRILTGTGFVQEGRARKGWDGKYDAIIYGILKEECRFLKDDK